MSSKSIDLAKELQMDSMYCAKSHYNASSFWVIVHYAIGIVMTASAAVAGIFIAKDGDVAQTTAFVSTSIATMFGAVSTFIKPSERSLQHKYAADSYLSLKNELKKSIAFNSDISEDDFMILSHKRDLILGEAPQIPWFAYRSAKKGIESGEANY